MIYIDTVYLNIIIYSLIIYPNVSPTIPGEPHHHAGELQRLALAVDMLRHNFQDVASVRGIQVTEAGIAGKPHQLIPGWAKLGKCVFPSPYITKRNTQ